MLLRLSPTYRYREGDDEDPSEGAQTAGQLAQEGVRLEVVAYCGQGHQAPPQAVVERPGLEIAS